MNCLIDNAISHYLNKGKKIEVIRRYIRLKYRVNVDLSVIKNRMQNLNRSIEVA